MTDKQLEQLEQLNEVALTDTEKKAMQDTFEFMADFEAKMQSADTKDTEVMVHVMPLENVFREDNSSQLVSRESLLEAGPEHTEDSWQVPRLVK